MKRNELQNNLAMTVLLISAAMLFVTLFMGYAVFRSSADVWPPMGVARVSLWLPLLSTILISFSSWYCYQVRLSVTKNDVPSAKSQLWLTMVLGAAFMLAQSSLWFSMKNSGVFVTSGIFASVMYGFTWIHAVHVVLGLFALGYLHWVLRQPAGNMLQKTINVEKFWHFLGVVWLVMFFGLFVF